MSSPMACNCWGVARLRRPFPDLCQIFRGGFSGKNSETDPLPQKDPQPFPIRACLEACLQTARRETIKWESKSGTIAYDTSFAKEKSSFRAHHRDLSRKALQTVLYEMSVKRLFDDAHIYCTTKSNSSGSVGYTIALVGITKVFGGSRGLSK